MRTIVSARRRLSNEKGITLVEVLVVAVLGILSSIISVAVGGVKDKSTEGQVQSDAKSVQLGLDGYNNASIRPRSFPDLLPDQVTSTPGALNYHVYADVVKVAPSGQTATGENVVLVLQDDTAELL